MLLHWHLPLAVGAELQPKMNKKPLQLTQFQYWALHCVQTALKFTCGSAGVAAAVAWHTIVAPDGLGLGTDGMSAPASVDAERSVDTARAPPS